MSRCRAVAFAAVAAFAAIAFTAGQTAGQPAGGQTAMPTPAEYFGVEIGDPGVLIKHGEILEYYRQLERLSDRVRIEVIGESTEGRPFYYAIVTSPENHARLDELMEMNHKLYDPRGVSDEDAQRIIRDGKTFVVANHQIHSTEVGASQGAILLAHRLASGNDHEVQRILDEVVLIHVPVHNPDGQEMVYDWLAEHRGTPYENTAPPFLYQKYTGHDNNPRLVHVHPGRDPALDRDPERVHAPVHAPPAPDGVERQPYLRAAVRGPVGARHRSGADRLQQHDRHVHGAVSDLQRLLRGGMEQALTMPGHRPAPTPTTTAVFES